jgi:hypothetical protein
MITGRNLTFVIKQDNWAYTDYQRRRKKKLEFDISQLKQGATDALREMFLPFLLPRWIQVCEKWPVGFTTGQWGSAR